MGKTNRRRRNQGEPPALSEGNETTTPHVAYYYGSDSDRRAFFVVLGFNQCVSDLKARRLAIQEKIKRISASPVPDLLAEQLLAVSEAISLIQKDIKDRHDNPRTLLIDWSHCSNCGQGKGEVVLHAKKIGVCPLCQKDAYCSRECQRQHWKEGGHRQSCPRVPQPKGFLIYRNCAQVETMKKAVGGTKISWEVVNSQLCEDIFTL